MKLLRQYKRFITAMFIGTIFWITFFYFPPILFSILLAMILMAILITEWTTLFKNNKALFWMLMPLYPVLPFILLIHMNHHSQYHILLYYLFLTVFSFDSTAYIVGILVGSHKIAPSISPGKTIEGCIGGFLGALSFFILATWEQGLHVSYRFSLLFVLGISVIAFLGDIFESSLKRRAGVKDSGSLLPGHGGFLDRFDAVMMVTFFFFIFRNQLTILLT